MFLERTYDNNVQRAIDANLDFVPAASPSHTDAPRTGRVVNRLRAPLASGRFAVGSIRKVRTPSA
jgi:hypothetical protein